MGLKQEIQCMCKSWLPWILLIFISIAVGGLVFVTSIELHKLDSIQQACKMAQEQRPMPPPMICP